MDMNREIENFAFTAQGRADALRGEAARLRAAPATGWPDYDRSTAEKARALDEKAAAWSARAVEARRGFLLVDTTDVKFQSEFSGIIGAAAAASRAKFLDPNGEAFATDQATVPGLVVRDGPA